MHTLTRARGEHAATHARRQARGQAQAISPAWQKCAVQPEQDLRLKTCGKEVGESSFGARASEPAAHRHICQFRFSLQSHSCTLLLPGLLVFATCREPRPGLQVCATRCGLGGPRSTDGPCCGRSSGFSNTASIGFRRTSWASRWGAGCRRACRGGRALRNLRWLVECAEPGLNIQARRGLCPWYLGTKNPASLTRCGMMFNLATSYFRIAFRHTIIGATAFHFRVRNGNGWYHCAMVTRLRLICG